MQAGRFRCRSACRPNDADDTVSVKISGVPSFDTITAGDGHAVAKKGNSYTFTAADVQSGLTLHSSYDGDRHHDEASLTVTASNTTAGEAATAAQTLKITTTPPMLTTATMRHCSINTWRLVSTMTMMVLGR